jgi:hypothetical protein
VLTQLDWEGTPLSFLKEVLGHLCAHVVAPLDGGESRAILRSTVMRKGEALSLFVSRFCAAAVAFSGLPAEVWSYFLLGVGPQVSSSLRNALLYAACPEGSSLKAHEFLQKGYARAQAMAIAREHEAAWAGQSTGFGEPMEIDAFTGSRSSTKLRSNVQSGPRCYNCGGRGHLAKQCPSKNPHKDEEKQRHVIINELDYNESFSTCLPVSPVSNVSPRIPTELPNVRGDLIELVAFSEANDSLYAYCAELLGHRSIHVTCLADSGASHNLMRHSIADTLNLPIAESGQINVSGFTARPTTQAKKMITVPIRIGRSSRPTQFLVLEKVSWEVILGRPWFRQEKPVFNWSTGSLQLIQEGVPLYPVKPP